MGIFRSYFRPDMSPEKSYFWHGSSTGNQEFRKTHNRRQRAYNKGMIRQVFLGEEDGDEVSALFAQGQRSSAVDTTKAGLPPGDTPGPISG